MTCYTISLRQTRAVFHCVAHVKPNQSNHTPCCEAAIHQQCLYRYINFQFTEKRFACPGCMTILSANRTLALHGHGGIDRGRDESRRSTNQHGRSRRSRSRHIVDAVQHADRHSRHATPQSALTQSSTFSSRTTDRTLTRWGACKKFE